MRLNKLTLIHRGIFGKARLYLEIIEHRNPDHSKLDVSNVLIIPHNFLLVLQKSEEKFILDF